MSIIATQRDKNIEVVPEVFKVFLLALIDVASQGKERNTPATILRQVQRIFYADGRRRHDGKDPKKDVTEGTDVPIKEENDSFGVDDPVSLL